MFRDEVDMFARPRPQLGYKYLRKQPSKKLALSPRCRLGNTGECCLAALVNETYRLHRHGYINQHPNGFWMLFGFPLVTLSMLTDGPFFLIQARPKEFCLIPRLPPLHPR